MGKSAKYKNVSGHEEEIKERLNKNRSIVYDCWVWNAAIGHDGYGSITLTLNKQEFTCRVHRLSFLVYKGSTTDNLVVRHSCHNRACFNPDHLSEGTQKDNIQDSIDEARHAFAERNGNSKLSNEQVIKIIKEFLNNPKIEQTKIAKDYNVSVDTIENIVNKKSWNSVWKEHFPNQSIDIQRHFSKCEEIAYSKGYRVKDGNIIGLRGPVGYMTGGNYEFSYKENNKVYSVRGIRFAGYCKYGVKIYSSGIVVTTKNGDETDLSDENIVLSTMKAVNSNETKETSLARKVKSTAANRALSPEQLDELWHDRIVLGWGYGKLSKKYGIAKNTAGYIVLGKTFIEESKPIKEKYFNLTK